MKIQNYLQTAALIVIALLLAFKNPTVNLAENTKDDVSIKYVTVIKRGAVDYDPLLGHGSLGFVVKDGNTDGFIPYDAGSHFDKMPLPKYLRIVEVGGKKSYSHVFELPDAN